MIYLTDMRYTIDWHPSVYLRRFIRQQHLDEFEICTIHGRGSGVDPISLGSVDLDLMATALCRLVKVDDRTRVHDRRLVLVSSGGRLDGLLDGRRIARVLCRHLHDRLLLGAPTTTKNERPRDQRRRGRWQQRYGRWCGIRVRSDANVTRSISQRHGR